MPRKPTPWLWKERNRWCVWLNGKLHNLGPDKEEAMKKFEALKACPTCGK